MSGVTLPSPLKRQLTSRLQDTRPETGFAFDDQEDFHSKVRKDGKTSAREVYKRHINSLGDSSPTGYSEASTKLASPQTSKSTFLSPQNSKESLASQLSVQPSVASEQSDAEWTIAELSHFEDVHLNKTRTASPPRTRYSPSSRSVPRLDLKRIDDPTVLQPLAETSRDSLEEDEGPPTANIERFPSPDGFQAQPGSQTARGESKLGRLATFEQDRRALTHRQPIGMTPRGMAQLPEKTQKLVNSIDRFYNREDSEARPMNSKTRRRQAFRPVDETSWGKSEWTGGKFRNREPFTPSWLLFASERSRTLEMKKEHAAMKPGFWGPPVVGGLVDPLARYPLQIRDGPAGVRMIPEYRFRGPALDADEVTLKGALDLDFKPRGQGADTLVWRQRVERPRLGALVSARWEQPLLNPPSNGRTHVMPSGWKGGFRATLEGSGKEGWRTRPLSPTTSGRPGTWLQTQKALPEKEAELLAGGAYYQGERKMPGWAKGPHKKGGGWREGAMAVAWENERKGFAEYGWSNWNYHELKRRMRDHDFRGLEEGPQKLQRDWQVFMRLQGMK